MSKYVSLILVLVSACTVFSQDNVVIGTKPTLAGFQPPISFSADETRLAAVNGTSVGIFALPGCMLQRRVSIPVPGNRSDDFVDSCFFTQSNEEIIILMDSGNVFIVDIGRNNTRARFEILPVSGFVAFDPEANSLAFIERCDASSRLVLIDVASLKRQEFSIENIPKVDDIVFLTKNIVRVAFHSFQDDVVMSFGNIPKSIISYIDVDLMEKEITSGELPIDNDFWYFGAFDTVTFAINKLNGESVVRRKNVFSYHDGFLVWPRNKRKVFCEISSDGTSWVFDARNGQIIHVGEECLPDSDEFFLSESGRYLAMVTEYHSAIRIWDNEQGEFIDEREFFPAKALVFLSPTTLLINDHASVSSWDIQSKTQSWRVHGRFEAIPLPGREIAVLTERSSGDLFLPQVSILDRISGQMLETDYFSTGTTAFFSGVFGSPKDSSTLYFSFGTKSKIGIVEWSQQSGRFNVVIDDIGEHYLVGVGGNNSASPVFVLADFGSVKLVNFSGETIGSYRFSGFAISDLFGQGSNRYMFLKNAETQKVELLKINFNDFSFLAIETPMKFKNLAYLHNRCHFINGKIFFIDRIGKVRCVSSTTGKELNVKIVPPIRPVNAIRFNPSTSMVAYGDSDGVITIHSIKNVLESQNEKKIP